MLCTFFFILALSSLYAASCFFHSSTLVVLSCSAAVRRALLFFRVCNSTSHFLALVELKTIEIHEYCSKIQENIHNLWYTYMCVSYKNILQLTLHLSTLYPYQYLLLRDNLKLMAIVLHTNLWARANLSRSFSYFSWLSAALLELLLGELGVLKEFRLSFKLTSCLDVSVVPYK